MTPSVEDLLQQAARAYARGCWRAAQEGYLAFLERWLPSGDPPGPLVWDALERAVELAALFGEVQQARRLIDGAVRLAALRHEPVWELRFRLLQADLEAQRGDRDQVASLLAGLEPWLGPLSSVPRQAAGLRVWEEGLRWPAGAHPADRTQLLAWACAVLGDWYAAEGVYTQAAVFLARGSEHAAPGGPAEADLVRLRLSLAGVRLEQGEVADAEAVLRPLQGRVVADGSPAARVRWLELAAQSALLRGRLGDALTAFYEVAQLCGPFDDQARLNALLNQAHVLVSLNQLPQAGEVLAEAWALARQLDEPARRRVACVDWLARARAGILAEDEVVPCTVTSGQRPRADGEGARGRAEQDGLLNPFDLPQPASFLALFETRALSVYRALEAEDFALARNCVERLRWVFADPESALIRLRLDGLDGLVCYYERDYPRAVELLEPARQELERLGLRTELLQVLRVLRWCRQQLAGEVESPAGAQASERVRGLVEELAGSLSPEQRAFWLANRWTPEEEGLGREVRALEAEGERVATSPWWLRPWRRWSLRRQLHALLHTVDRYRAERGRPAPGTAADVGSLWRRLWRHPRDRVTLSFLVLPDALLVVRTGWLDLDFVVLKRTRLDLRSRVADWHRACGSLVGPGKPPPPVRQRTAQDIDRQAAALSAVLGLDNLLAGLPRRVKGLTIVPDDALHGWPFAALRVGGQRLAERFSLALGFERTGATRHRPARVATALAVAVPDGFTDEHGVPLHDLPRVAEEAEHLTSHLSALGVSVTPLKGARRQAVLDAWPGADLVHLGCHGEFCPDAPEESGLWLNPGRPERLTRRDLAGLAGGRMPAHVTLSCCWGADSFVLPGRWVISLPETLCRLGAGSVLGCLWPVSSSAGLDFLRRFYDRLPGLPRDQALQAAQGDFRDKPLADWAGFQLYGEPGPLLFGDRR